MKPKVFITRPVPEAVLARIASECEMEWNREDRLLSREELAGRLAGSEGVLCQLTDRIDDVVMEQAPLLKVIANVAVGYDNIDVTSATRRGILVTNTPEVLTDTTADFAFALLLASARRVAEADQFVRSGQWKEWKLDLMLGTDAHHATLGIIGLGRIGRAVARRARGFSMNVLYSAPRRAGPQVEQELGVSYVEKDVLLRESDFISLHVPLKPETRHMIGQPEFDRMKPTAILINTARGPIVDEKALVEALQKGRIGGAGLDVFEDEPRPNPQLARLSNVVLAPHIGSASRQTRLRMAEMAAENLVAGVSGRIPPNLVNRELAEAGSKQQRGKG
jgi:glyoxylate reductase